MTALTTEKKLRLVNKCILSNFKLKLFLFAFQI